MPNYRRYIIFCAVAQCRQHVGSVELCSLSWLTIPDRIKLIQFNYQKVLSRTNQSMMKMMKETFGMERLVPVAAPSQSAAATATAPMTTTTTTKATTATMTKTTTTTTKTTTTTTTKMTTKQRMERVGKGR